ncbi:MAG TPA: terpene cyclase/mutase family protein [Candidatus Monoglobus merdigallinarum]|uniref:Terpene cyclase/mutase family protein n=1 Tax=Candidatus Monoglobus merdigallinarum TaxID=2838698 RepID=A0A9D1PRM6_9FIRM|nr:terpene cyclase/mutase family protein [Candidatus Monoglobus merdigallinarum]
MKISKIITAFVLCISFTLCTAYAAPAADETADCLFSIAPSPAVASIGGEWTVIGLKRSSLNIPDSYFNEYESRAAEALISSGGDLGRKYTEYSRMAIALAVIGKDPFNVGGYNLFDYINDFDKVVSQGINGAISALLAKDICNDSDYAAAEKYMNFILENQHQNGSFGMSENSSDTDVTAMAVTALCPHQGDFRIDRAINRAFLYLSEVQLSDGSFSPSPDDNTGSCESTAQVIIAMRAFGLSENDSYFVKDGNTVYDGLNVFRCDGGGYKHITAETGTNQMATEQALLALTQPQQPVKTLIYDRIWFEAGAEYFKESV